MPWSNSTETRTVFSSSTTYPLVGDLINLFHAAGLFVCLLKIAVMFPSNKETSSMKWAKSIIKTLD